MFIVIDRHSNPELFEDDFKAILRAKSLAERHARRKSDYSEVTPSNEMERDGIIFYIQYSVEGDCVRVLEREVQ